MGIFNTTPDSFSDGGDCLDPAQAVERGLALVAEGRLPPPREHDRATAAVSAPAAASGAWCVQVHDVLSTADAVRVARQLTSGHPPYPPLRKAVA